MLFINFVQLLCWIASRMLFINFVELLCWIASRMLLFNFTHYKVIKWLWFPYTLAVAEMLCWQTEIAVGYFSKNLNGSVLAQVSRTGTIFLDFLCNSMSHSLAIAYKFKISMQFFSILQNW
jgi:hypothetical protein